MSGTNVLTYLDTYANNWRIEKWLKARRGKGLNGIDVSMKKG